MDPKAFHRKLAAILSADVAGYSRLMQDDEAATVATLEVLQTGLLRAHPAAPGPGGRFAGRQPPSRVRQCGGRGAVRGGGAEGAAGAQRRATREPASMLFRIGVNLGDVIEEGDRIYGDGVNIAARLESLADAGGICVSKTAFDQIETKLPFSYEFLGDQPVKNIAKPVGAYRVLLEPRVTKGKGSGFRVQGARQRKMIAGLAVVLLLAAVGGLWQVFLQPGAPPPAPPVEKADPKQMALPLPDLPSIAVLPFVNLSEDSKQQLLCDGITDNIINALSIIPRLLVIARNSTFAYKGKTVYGKASE